MKSMERLQKVIAEAGIASRRKAEELIVNGKVKVNGKVVTELGTKVDSKDEIMVISLTTVDIIRESFFNKMTNIL